MAKKELLFTIGCAIILLQRENEKLINKIKQSRLHSFYYGAPDLTVPENKLQV